LGYARSQRCSIEANAQRALEDCLRDEREWRGLLRVEPIDFNLADASPN
jgi:hypothetical protein